MSQAERISYLDFLARSAWRDVSRCVRLAVIYPEQAAYFTTRAVFARQDAHKYEDEARRLRAGTEVA